MVARLSDGSWSAPSAIATVGGGFGGQIGFELTDFVFILNDRAAVQAFAQQASVTLGGNVSIAAGPVGRNAEAAGAASLKGVAGVFAYSKTKGLFAGVSLEGSVLIERRDANEKLYNGKVTARSLLEGSIRPPPVADPLMRVLNSRVFSPNAAGYNDGIYNDIPVYDDKHDDVVWEGRRGEAFGENRRVQRSNTLNSRDDDEYEYRDNPAPRRTTTWNDDIYDRPVGGNNVTGRNRAASDVVDRDRFDSRNRSDSYTYNDNKPSRPSAPKPVFRQKTGDLAANQGLALFTFDSEQAGDLGFKKGDIVTILKRTENKTDWWTGELNGKTGIFPSNYIETRN